MVHANDMLLRGFRKSSAERKERLNDTTAAVPSRLGDLGLRKDDNSSDEQPHHNTASFVLTPQSNSTDGLERISHAVERSISPPPRSISPRRQRFSMLKFRHASDPQLFTRFRQDAQDNSNPSEVASEHAPSVANTPNTTDSAIQQRRRRVPNLFGLNGRSKTPNNDRLRTPDTSAPRSSTNSAHISFGDPSRLSAYSFRAAPPHYGDSHGPTSGLRYSESSPSEGSSSGPVAYAQTTTTHTSPTNTAFFRLPRRKTKRGSLFPLPIKISPPTSHNSNSPPQTAVHRPNYARGSQSAGALSTLLRRNSNGSAQSAISSPGVPPFAWRGDRSRSSTMNSGNEPHGSYRAQLSESGRNSTASTLGRGSNAFKTISQKLRQSSEGHSPRRSSPGNTLVGTPRGSSNPNSFNLSRDTLVIPEREEGETPVKYLERLRQAIPHKIIATVLSKSADPFSHDVLRSFLRTFAFFEEPLDMSVRKLLWSIDLPSEAQQIDRVIHALAERYHECNPGIFKSPDVTYFAAYSLIILHSDLFNKNNKHKMQRSQYQKNTGGQGIPEEILGYFYDNIQYTEFIRKLDEDDVDSNRSISAHRKSKKLRTKNLVVDAPGKLDPYDLILEEKLPILRPQLKDVMNLEDPYDYHATHRQWDMRKLQGSFARSGILQLMSYRSRPEAFMSPSTTNNPEEASPGIVDIKITKVGLLWRKGPKKSKTRSPWQEWGALLTSNQLFLMKNAGWVKGLVQQYDTHHKQGNGAIAVVFKPALKEFKPDTTLPLLNTIALRDSSYKKHKNAFIYARSGGHEEVFLAESEPEMNDWLAKLNYASTFKSSNIAMRSFQPIPKPTKTKADELQQAPTSPNSKTSGPGTVPETEIKSGITDAQKIIIARRQAIMRSIAAAEEGLRLRSEDLEENLRTARHLQVLAPIQPKTREYVILEAGRMAAKLKWLRFEIWRMRCHKDVLTRELDEENKGLGVARSIHSSTNPLSPSTTRNSNSPGYVTPKRSQSSQPQSPSAKSQKRQSIVSIESSVDGEAFNELLLTPSRPSPVSHSAQRPASPLILALDSDNVFSSLSDDPGEATPKAAFPKIRGSSSLEEMTANIGDMATQIITPPASLHEKDGTSNARRASNAADSDKEHRSVVSSPGSRSKPRRGLHKTLRDSREFRGQHHRSRKGKESNSSATIDDASSATGSEVLSRGKGSFTVHGKKASVITFGSEWQNMSAEERLQMRKQAKSDDRKSLETSTIQDSAEESATAASEDGSYRGPRFSGLNGASFHVGEDGTILFYDAPSLNGGQSLTRRSSQASRPSIYDNADLDQVTIGQLANYKNHEMAEDDGGDDIIGNVER